jgi:cell division protein FtsW (lipid II flippase)
MEFGKNYLKSISLFAFGLLLIVATDFAIRAYRGDANNLGLPEAVWFSFHILAGIFSAIQFWKNSFQKPIWIRIGCTLLLLLAFVVMYILIIYGYVIGTEIDGF